jgi:hypothetical protein
MKTMKSSPFRCEASAANRPAGADRAATLGVRRTASERESSQMEHPDGRRIVFPFHDEIDRYTLKGALRDATIPVEDFLKNVK